jgi:hypothetical protein
VSPALFATSNNITSVTVGGSANTISLTFDSNGVITGASNNALSVANTAITGLIQAAQIGSANATLVTSGTLPAAALPAGSVLQVVSATTGTTTSTTSTSFVTTALTASITPRSASNKIYISISGCGYSPLNEQIYFTIYRASTNLAGANGFTNQWFAGQRGIMPVSICYLDSPSTTSSTAYTVYIRTISATSSDFPNNGTASINLMEIAG